MIRNENQEFTFFLINDIKKYIQIQIWIIQVKKRKDCQKNFLCEREIEIIEHNVFYHILLLKILPYFNNRIKYFLFHF